MSETTSPTGLLCTFDPPVENNVEPLIIKLEDIKAEPPEEELDRLQPLSVTVRDIKTEVPELFPIIGEPGCSRWGDGFVTDYSLKVKEVPDEECSSSSYARYIQTQPTGPKLKQEILSSDEDRHLGPENEKMPSIVKSDQDDTKINTEVDLKPEEWTLDEAGSSDLPDIEMKTELKVKREELMLYEAGSSGQLNNTSGPREEYVGIDDIFQCTSCNYKTNRKYHIKRHVIAKHATLLDVEIFQCALCNFKYKDKDNLRKHLVRSHHFLPHPKTDKATLILRCTFCEYKTQRKGDLTRHLLNKHPSADEIKTYQCTLCDVKFKQEEYLKKHMKRHT